MNDYSIEPVVDSELYEVEEIRHLYDLFDVISVHKIQNPLLWGLYTLRKNEMEINNKNIIVNEWLLYHVTATKNVQSIAENNLDWRFTSRCRYGKGVCFSYCPLYANRYASCAQGSTSAVDYDENIMDILINMGFPREAVKRALFYTYNQGLECAIKWLMDHITDSNFAEPFVPSRHNFNSEISIERAFIICRVLVQNIKDVSVNYHLNVIPNIFDTAKSTNGMVYVKFNDYEFYPQYIVYYREHNLSQYSDPYSCNFNYNYCVDQ
ncbi:uncharacterized protein LOC114132177 isoform X3 [Aphis gossypii]|nr:uncharacterized protein LOC114132177 isoform X3 [Aphis gossypii]CAH1714505.1 unnamed protein product [Aphis gossypii]